MTPARWRYTSDYLRDVFGAEDEGLAQLTAAADAAGLPKIAISGDVGRLLTLLTSFTRGRLALELGTLAGYSAVWIARGLAPDGRLITVERDPRHAEVAREGIAACGEDHRVEVRVQGALEALEALRGELPPESLDLVFLDADKRDYPAYFEAARPLIAPGGLLVADNALGSSQWWIDDEGHPDRAGADALNRRLAADQEYTAVGLPIREGLLVARRTPTA